ncbi:MAG: proline dehydrogenase family protein, partial [Bacteroidota bacterium]|nr:proline dehydrogenase family protein [Bacteroidota bacterium]
MPEISFDNTKTAFEYKSDRELERAKFLFSTMGKDWVLQMGLKMTPWALKWGLPIRGIIRNTIFNQFVGGETLEETAAVAEKLGQFNVDIILDYGVEGKEGEANFDHARDVFINSIRYAASHSHIPFMSVKLTGYARFGLLEKLHAASSYHDIIQGKLPLYAISEREKQEWERVVQRIDQICESAKKNHIGVLIDAEETWIQDPIDALTTQMMQKHNQETAVVYNTAQLYRKDRLQFIKDSNSWASQNHFKLGMKLVRGAYMDKERERASTFNYPSPIHETKEDTDRDFNEALNYCISPSNDIYIVVGTHNEYSNMYATELMNQYGIPFQSRQVHFSQLYGMSDNITFNLAKAGCFVSKYLPFGPIADVIPYLMRRAQENASVSGQTGRELLLIRQELQR